MHRCTSEIKAIKYFTGDYNETYNIKYVTGLKLIHCIRFLHVFFYATHFSALWQQQKRLDGAKKATLPRTAL